MVVVGGVRVGGMVFVKGKCGVLVVGGFCLGLEGGIVGGVVFGCLGEGVFLGDVDGFGS